MYGWTRSSGLARRHGAKGGHVNMLCVRNPLMESSAGAAGAEEDTAGSKSGRRRPQRKSSLSSGLSGQTVSLRLLGPQSFSEQP